MTIGPVHVGAHGNRSAILAGTDHEVTFQGRPSVTIAPGADVISDPVRFSVSPLEEIAVSVYVPLGAGPSTIHSDGIQTAYIIRRWTAIRAGRMHSRRVCSPTPGSPRLPW